MEDNREMSEKKREITEADGAAPEKKRWEEPRLDFVEPKLTKHGSLEKVTRMPDGNGFFGGFSP